MYRETLNKNPAGSPYPLQILHARSGEEGGWAHEGPELQMHVLQQPEAL